MMRLATADGRFLVGTWSSENRWRKLGSCGLTAARGPDLSIFGSRPPPFTSTLPALSPGDMGVSMTPLRRDEAG